VIRLGSLREICKELDLSAGKAASDVKTALQQNASAFITAKVSFRGNDGSEQRFEASFTRYGLRFYGQSFPDGKRADAVLRSAATPTARRCESTRSISLTSDRAISTMSMEEQIRVPAVGER
jgi:hypothetical protein